MPFVSYLSFLGCRTDRFGAIGVCAKPKAACSAGCTAASHCMRPDPGSRPTSLCTLKFSEILAGAGLALLPLGRPRSRGGVGCTTMSANVGGNA